MNEYLPNYRRGESLTGYIARCQSGRKLVEGVPSIIDRMYICKDHALQIRKAIGQPFTKNKK